MSALAKPALRGHLRRGIIKAVIGAGITSVSCVLALNFFYVVPKRAAYAEFHRTYDPEKHIKELKKYDYLQSAKGK